MKIICVFFMCVILGCSHEEPGISEKIKSSPVTALNSDFNLIKRNREVTDSINFKRDNEIKKLRKIESEKDFKNLRLTVDEFRNAKYYYYKGSSKNFTNQFYLYLVKVDGLDPIIRLDIQYTASDWLFIENYTIKCADSVFEILPLKVERDNQSEIYEWSDEIVNTSTLKIINSIIRNKSAQIRHNGRQYYRDRTFSKREIEGLKVVLNGYYHLTGRDYNP